MTKIIRDIKKISIPSLILIFFAACSGQEEASNKSAYVSFSVPSSLQKEIENKTSQLKSRQAISAGNVPLPTTLAEQNCYAVFVAWPGSTGATCIDPQGEALFSAGQTIGFSNYNEEIFIEADAGPAREFILVGARSTTGNCPDLQDINETTWETLSAPQVLGRATTDLTPGEQSVSLTISMTGAKILADCDGPLLDLPSSGAEAIWDISSWDEASWGP